jgi:hypothetical protein
LISKAKQSGKHGTEEKVNDFLTLPKFDKQIMIILSVSRIYLIRHVARRSHDKVHRESKPTRRSARSLKRHFFTRGYYSLISLHHLFRIEYANDLRTQL